MLDPASMARIRALAERLVAQPSVSPDPETETACARLLASHLPANAKAGEWATPDGRPVIWALRRGRSPRTVVLLGHYDTVGVGEYAMCGEPELAFRPAELLRVLLERPTPAGSGPLPEDLEEERREPGTWLFGRGALDMKSGLAAGLTAFERLAAEGDRAEGSVLFVATPDEEHESAGMIAALEGMIDLREAEALEYLGALNLDYAEEPALHRGVMGKHLLAAYVLGRPTHVGAPETGVDAAEMAAAIVLHTARTAALADAWHGHRGAPSVPLRLRDLKSGYSVQTTFEATLELNVLVFTRPLVGSLEELRGAVREALARPLRPGRGAVDPRVLTWSELSRLSPATALPAAERAQGTRAAAIDRIRIALREARVEGPALVLYALPPYYPPSAPGSGPLVRAAAEACGPSIPVRDHYPFISDASYLAWRSEPAERVAAEIPDREAGIRLPAARAAALDLDVVNLGPWGRDAHGPFERVHAPYAFGRLPELIEATIRAAWRTG